MKKMILFSSKHEVAFLAAFLSLISVQIGAAIAKTIFPILGPESVALMRLGLSAVLLWIMFKPWKGLNRNVYWKDLVCYGVILSLMNLLIYKAFSYLPVGIAISIEVLGPLAVAIFMSRHKLDLIWGGLALIGLVLFPSDNIANNLSYIGMFYALGAAVCWGLYIIYGANVAKGGGNSVAIGMAIAALCASPFGIWNISGIFESSWILLLCFLVSLLSSTIPFLLDIFAMKTLSPKFFGILLSTSPIVSALAGWIILGEKLINHQLIGITIIMVSCMGCFFCSYKKSTTHLT
jgi:inner membrane transporter RhtA